MIKKNIQFCILIVSIFIINNFIFKYNEFTFLNDDGPYCLFILNQPLYELLIQSKISGGIYFLNSIIQYPIILDFGFHSILYNFFLFFNSDPILTYQNLLYFSNYLKGIVCFLSFTYFLNSKRILALFISLLYTYLPFFYLGQTQIIYANAVFIPFILLHTLSIYGFTEKKFSGNNKLFLLIIYTFFLISGIQYTLYFFLIHLILIIYKKINIFTFQNTNIKFFVIFSLFVFIAFFSLNFFLFQIQVDKSFYNQLFQRNFLGTEIYGLKLVSIFMPIELHILNFLGKFHSFYFANTNIAGMEQLRTSVGLLGSITLTYLLFYKIFNKEKSEIVNILSTLTLCFILISLNSSFTTIISVYFDIQPVRAGSRSIPWLYIIGMINLSIIINKYFNNGNFKKELVCSIILLLSLIDILPLGNNEAKASLIRENRKLKNSFYETLSFTNLITKKYDITDKKIFTYPGICFPETNDINKFKSYDNLRFYIFEQKVKWSSPLIKNTPDCFIGSLLHSKLYSSNELLINLKNLGFEGLIIDLFSVKNSEIILEEYKHLILEKSENNRYIFAKIDNSNLLNSDKDINKIICSYKDSSAELCNKYSYKYIFDISNNFDNYLISTTDQRVKHDEKKFIRIRIKERLDKTKYIIKITTKKFQSKRLIKSMKIRNVDIIVKNPNDDFYILDLPKKYKNKKLWLNIELYNESDRDLLKFLYIAEIE